MQRRAVYVTGQSLPAEGDSLDAPDIDSLLAEIVEFVRPPERPGPEWFTAAEVAQQLGEPADRISKRLRSRAEAGQLERAQAGRFVYYRLALSGAEGKVKHGTTIS